MELPNMLLVSYEEEKKRMSKRMYNAETRGTGSRCGTRLLGVGDN